MDDIKVADKKLDLDIDDVDNDDIRISYSNWRQGGAVGTAINQTPKAASQVFMPSTAIYLRYYIETVFNIHTVLTFTFI